MLAAARSWSGWSGRSRCRTGSTVCEELYSAAVRLEAGGKECPKLLERVTGGLEDPTITLRSIKLGDHAALVGVTTVATGQEPVDELIRLERDEDGRFRIAGLG